MTITAWFRNLLNVWFPQKPTIINEEVSYQIKPDFFTGALPDTRSQEDKDKDYLHEEREPVKATDPFGNAKITVSPYPYENQQGTSSCLPHGVGLAYAIFRSMIAGPYIRLGWLFNYRLRPNYPGEGMVPVVCASLYKSLGAPLYSSAPDTATESEANKLVITDAMRNEAQIFDQGEFYSVTNLDIDTLAALSEQGKAVAITIYATYAEWAKEYPTVDIPTLKVSDPRAVVNHEICILPKSGFMENGRKYLTIQDSAWFGGFKLRNLSQDFIAKRVVTGLYWTEAKLDGGGTHPHFKFTRSLKVGDSGADVKALQQLLIAENLLPSDLATGLFAGRTLAGVRAFQVKYSDEILTPQGLTAPTSIFGLGSIRKANTLCL